MAIELLNPIAAFSFRAGPRIWAGAWPPTEKAPLESVLYCWNACVSHAAVTRYSVDFAGTRTWTDLVMAPSTAELYTPRRDINGSKCALSGLQKNLVFLQTNLVKQRKNPVEPQLLEPAVAHSRTVV